MAQENMEDTVQNRSKQELLQMLEEKEEKIEDLEKRLERQRYDFQEIWHLANNIHAQSMEGHDIPRFQRLVQNTIQGHFGVREVGLFQKDFSRWNTFTWRDWSGSDDRKIASFTDDDPEYEFFSRDYQVYTASDLQEEEDLDDFYRLCEEHDLKYFLPLVLEGEEEYETLQGVLMLGEKFDGSSFSDKEIRFLELLGRMSAISFQNAALHRRSITDSLTGLFGRGHFNFRMEQEIARMRRMEEDQPREKQTEEIVVFSLLLLDIDYFKEINDEYGHPAGDRILKRLSHLLQQSVRQADVVARYGGEEFAVILPEASKEVSYQTGERLRQKIAEERFEVETSEEPLSVTVSGGVSTYPEDGEDPQKLISKADQALYEAKAQGRNQIIHCQDLA